MHKKFPIIASGLVFLSIASIPAALGAHPTPTKVSHLTPSQHREKPKCRIEIDTVHLSTYLKNKGIGAAKVNARSICNVTQLDVALTVQIFKVGFILDHLVSATSTNPSNPNSSGFTIKNEGTYVLCASRKRTSYYGIAFSKATIGGQRVGAPPARSLKITTLPCGT